MASPTLSTLLEKPEILHVPDIDSGLVDLKAANCKFVCCGAGKTGLSLSARPVFEEGKRNRADRLHQESPNRASPARGRGGRKVNSSERSRVISSGTSILIAVSVLRSLAAINRAPRFPFPALLASVCRERDLCFTGGLVTGKQGRSLPYYKGIP